MYGHFEKKTPLFHVIKSKYSPVGHCNIWQTYQSLSSTDSDSFTHNKSTFLVAFPGREGTLGFFFITSPQSSIIIFSYSFA